MDEINNPKEGSAFVSITIDDKKWIYQLWIKALIVKVYGKTVGYNFLKRKLHELWQPNEELNIIDLGKDFFLIDFTLSENYFKAIHGGSWFIGGHFLAIRQWEAAFTPSTNTFSYTSLWIRLPELPFEFYDQQILCRIGNTIDQLLRMDICTQNTKRGQYVRLCIQVQIDQPMLTSIYTSNHQRRILYEGINLLCYQCGRVGHSSLNSAYKNMIIQPMSPTHANPNSCSETTP